MQGPRTTAAAAILLVRCGALLDLPEAPELAGKSHAGATRAGDPRGSRHGAPLPPAEPDRPLVPAVPLGASVDAGGARPLTPIASETSTPDAGIRLEPGASLEPEGPADAGVDAAAEPVP